MLMPVGVGRQGDALGDKRKMGDIGIPELLIILAIAIVLIGPARIDGIGRALGEAIRDFRQAVKGEDERTPASDEQAHLAESPHVRE